MWFQVRRAGVLELSILCTLLLVGVGLPVLVGFHLSLLSWSPDANMWHGAWNLAAYESLGQRGVSGAVLVTVRTTVAATFVTAAVTVLPCTAAYLLGHRRLLAALEAALVLPFFMNEGLRLLALRRVLRDGGAVASFLARFGVRGTEGLAFSHGALVAALALGFGAFFVLPFVHYLKTIPNSFALAWDDLSLPLHTLIARCLYPAVWRGAVVGATLMIVAGGLSSLSVQLMGRAQSIDAVFGSLLGAERYPVVFAMIVTVLASGALLLGAIMSMIDPARLILGETPGD